MSPRPYRLGRREAGVEETRERLIQAARKVFSSSGFAQISLDDVAREAGVGRATVYYQFGSKTGLLQAAIEGIATENRRGRLGQARAKDDPRAGLLDYLDDIGGVWERNSAFLRNVAGIAVLEPEIADAVRQYEDRRREGLTWLVKRLRDADQLRPDTSHTRAVDMMWTLSSFRSYDHLRRYVSLPPRQTAAVLRALAVSMLQPADGVSA